MCTYPDDNPELIDRKNASHILGASQRYIRRLVQNGCLQSRRVQCGRFYAHPLTKDSLTALLLQLLPPWVSPEDWIEDRLDSKEPLLSIPEVARQLRIKPDDAVRLLRKEKLPYINSPGSKYTRRKVQPDTLRAYLEFGKKLSVNDLRRILCCTTSGFKNWRRNGYLNCNIHTDHTLITYRSCVLALLRKWLSPGIAPGNWYNARLSGNRRVYGSVKAAQYLGVSQTKLRKMARMGEIQCLKWPHGQIIITYEQLRKVRKRMAGR